MSIFAFWIMKICKNIIETALVSMCAVLCFSCGELPSTPADDVRLARVGRKVLYSSEVLDVMPKNTSGEDSVQFVGSYVDRWIVKQLKVEQAESMFSSSASDIEKQVEEYRQSLLIKKFEQHYLDNEMTEISDEEIEAYYNAHKSEMRLDRTVVKGTIVSFGEKFRQKEKLMENMKSDNAAAHQEFRDMCIKNNFPLHEFKDWVDFSEFLSLLPTVRTANYDALTSRSGIQKMNAAGIQYCFCITAVLNKGDIQPLEMSRDMVKRILETQRRGEIIRDHENEIMQSEAAKKHVKRYIDEDK